jgi:L-arabinose isomerase
MGWHGEFIGQVRAHQVEVVDFGMVDNAAGAQALLPRVKTADIDLLFVDMVTYATSATFGIIARALDVPIVLVALQPMRCMDYNRATTFMQLCNDNICAMPEFCNAMVRMGRTAPPTVIGTLHDDPQAAGEIARWVRIARVLHDVKRAGHFGSCVRTFLSRWFAEGPTHHFALGVGHHAEDQRLVGEALGIETVIVHGA